MLGAVLGVMIWMLFFVVVGLGFMGLFSPGLWGLLEVILTWVQVPVVGVALAALYEGGLPGGIGELKSAWKWINAHDPDESVDYQAMPANTILVALELGAATLSGVGLILSTFFAMGLTVASINAFGGFNPVNRGFLGIKPSEAFGVFLAGAILWQVALFLEALET